MSVLVIVCGVSGSGKSTIGSQIAAALKLPFYDADDFHPASNKEKMSLGIPLDDDDRLPWLEVLAANLSHWESTGGAVLACSALKESYREILRAQCSGETRWIFLHGSKHILAGRLAKRERHFFAQELLESQLDTLEIPEYGWLIDIEACPKDIVNTILKRLSGA